MKIAIGKLGRSIYFDPRNRTLHGGDEEAPLMYCMLARRHPEHTFYLLGHSDITRTRDKQTKNSLAAFIGETEENKIDIPENIIDLLKDYDRKSSEDVHIWIEKRIKELGIEFDTGLIYQGPSPHIGVPHMGIPRLDGKGEAKTLMMFANYYAPIMHILNITQMPYVMVCGDPRYVPPMQRDCFNDEKIVLSQTNQPDVKVKRICEYGTADIRHATISYEYAGVETVFLLDEHKVDWRGREKETQFVVGLNGGFSRDEFIREWVLNDERANGVKVYGKWDEKFLNEYPDVFEEKSIREVEHVFWDARYTIIPPPHKPVGHFVTQKFWKMIYYGIIPFFHPQYDTDHILDVPDVLRVTGPNDMWDKIAKLDENPKVRQHIQEKLYNMLDDAYFDGSFLHDKVSNAFKKYVGKEL